MISPYHHDWSNDLIFQNSVFLSVEMGKILHRIAIELSEAFGNSWHNVWHILAQ